jgi:hypothetical protein
MGEPRLMTSSGLAQAKNELKGRIRRIRLEDALVEMACGLCIDAVPPETAFQKIQDKALEKLVSLLDTKILHDPEAIEGCLQVVAEESERVAWKALQKGTEILEEGLTMLEMGAIEPPDGGFVN